MSASSLPPRLTDEQELDAIEKWCVDALEQYSQPVNRIPMWVETVCEYDAHLPTHSIRSTITSLVAEIRRLRERETALTVALARLLNVIVWSEHSRSYRLDGYDQVTLAVNDAENALVAGASE